jgi:hypothetical protein
MMNVENLADSFLKGLDFPALSQEIDSNLSTTNESLESKASIKKAEENSIAIREQCKPLVGFIRAAWPHIPELADKPYVHGWHIDVISLHLEAISSGKLLEMGYQNRFLANIPPGTMKSLLCSVFWPAWEWTQDPSLQFIATSYRDDFCNRDTSRMRALVCSEWYQMLWGKDHEVNGKLVRGVEMVARGDSRISNTAGGWREGVPFGSLTGSRADRIILDDPSSVDTAESDAQRNRTALRFRESVPLRLNNPQKSAIVVIMQRLHVDDVSGIIENLIFRMSKSCCLWSSRWRGAALRQLREIPDASKASCFSQSGCPVKS